MVQVSEITNFHKNYLLREAKKITLQQIKEGSKRARKDHLLSENLARGQFTVALLADNRKNNVPTELIVKLQKKISQLGFTCTLGNAYYQWMNGCFDNEVEEEIVKNDLIIMVNGKRPATIGESKKTRLDPEWKKKALFFFRYKDYDELKSYAINKSFPIDFKYPIPYRDNAELEAKIIFGVLHWHYYKFRKKRTNRGGRLHGRKY